MLLLATIVSYVWNSTGTAVVTNPSSQPNALAVDSSNALYVVESAQNRVQKYVFGASNNSTTVAGQMNGASGSTSDFLNGPSDVAVDSSGNVYVLDKLNNRVQLWNSGASNGTTVAGFIRWTLGASNWTLIAGSANGVAGSSSTMLNTPMGLTLDPSGNIYVADSLNHRIQFFANQSNGTTIAGITGAAGSSATQLNIPQGVALDSQLNLYVADWGNDRVQKFSRS
ncbi:unnamed protein product [Rotaria sp. Silwood2]|nr:unnamed protein product [Rotaria sp. Silwood2]